MFNLTHRLELLGEAFFSYCQPTPLNNSRLVHVNRELQQELALSKLSDETLTQLISGQQQLEGYAPLAMVYAGHQFGIAVGQLGDGRALLIAEHIDNQSRVWELQLKGAGKTPYSRMGDGRAVLRSTIREYLGSHAMAKLAIPTTTALAMIHSSDPVYREQVEKAAVLLRVAPSFIRFGHFEFFAKRNKKPELTTLIEFICRNYYPAIDLSQPDYIAEFLLQVIKNTAATIAQWQSVGFVHGVMNSDNMSILGLTIDYGPFAFMDAFNPEQIFNHSDSEGRYVYAKQIYIGWWNLYRLAESLAVVYSDASGLEQILAKFPDYFNVKYLQLMGAKLGINEFAASDLPLLHELLAILQTYALDWTFFWRKLSCSTVGWQAIQDAYPAAIEALDQWQLKLFARWSEQGISPEELAFAMQQVNPAVVLRNHLLQDAISKAEQNNYSEIERLFAALNNPFREDAKYSDYYELPPEWSKYLVLSCSS